MIKDNPSDTDQYLTMKAWFCANYLRRSDAPVIEIFEDQNGDTEYFQGEPRMADDILLEQFGRVKSAAVIEQLIRDLNRESAEWIAIAIPEQEPEPMEIQ